MNVELKSSSYFASIGLPLEDVVLSSLRDHGLDRRGSGVLLQSFETTNLRWLRDRTDLPLVQLIEASGAPADLVALGDPTTYDDLCTPAGLRAVARYADAVGVARTRLLARPDLVEDAHLNGLQVLAWTVRDDDPGGPALVDRGDPGAAGCRRRRVVQRPAGHDPAGPRRLGRRPAEPRGQPCCGCGTGTGVAGKTSTSFGTISQATR